MNPDYEKQLEAAVRRELKSLDELEAPPQIARRVLGAIERRAATPWFRREWQAWPPALQAVSLFCLLTLFAALCFGGSTLVHFAAVSPVAREITGWFNLFGAVWNAAAVLANALGLAFRSLGPAAVIGAVVLVAACYISCMGLGTVYWRLAWAPLKEKSS